MKTILPGIFLIVSSAAYAQSATPPACDDLKGLEQQACIKKGGTVKANTAGSGATVAPKPSKPEPEAKKDYGKPDEKKRESR